MTPEEYAKHWESSDHWGDSGLVGEKLQEE